MIRAFPAGRNGALVAFVMLTLTAAAGHAAAQFPPLTGRVVDAAQMIDAETRTDIEARLAAHEALSSDQLVVATIPGLAGANLEDYANRLFRAWGLGQANQNNGVLLLVVRDERRLRIEVGYGLEGLLTDLRARLIIENTIVPAFRKGDYASGIAAGVDDILLVLRGDGEALEERLASRRPGLDILPLLFLILWLSLFASIFATMILAPVFGRKIGPNRYRWLGMDVAIGGPGGRLGARSGGGSSSRGGFSGGGGSSGGGGASGGW